MSLSRLTRLVKCLNPTLLSTVPDVLAIVDGLESIKKVRESTRANHLGEHSTRRLIFSRRLAKLR